MNHYRVIGTATVRIDATAALHQGCKATVIVENIDSIIVELYEDKILIKLNKPECNSNLFCCLLFYKGAFSMVMTVLSGSLSLSSSLLSYSLSYSF